MDRGIRIEMLGGFRVLSGGNSSTRVQTQKTGALLAYLAYYSKHAHPREILVDILWPEAEIEAGLSRLKNLLWLLKQEIGSELPLVIASRSHIQLDPDTCTTDVGELLLAAAASQTASGTAMQVAALDRAVALLQGELLPGRYEDWVLHERKNVRDLDIHVRLKLARALSLSGEMERSLQLAEAAVRADPLREDSHAELMRLYAAAGKPQEALRQYRELDRILWDEIGEQPSAALKELDRDIRAQRPQAAAVAAPVEPRAIVAPAAVQEAVGGAVPLGSPFYLERAADAVMLGAVSRGESVVLVKGPRQVGKTSLMARAMAHARSSGMTVVTTDLQKMNVSQLTSIEGFYRCCAEIMAEQLDIECAAIATIGQRAGPNIDFERFVRRDVLTSTESHVFWALDEVDRLLTCDYRSEVFGLFRSWHNDRAMRPDAPWLRLTLGVAYATEAHLLISDLNQSPFNVGVTVTLDDFNEAQLADLNGRYGGPLRDDADLRRFYDLFGGVPYLARRALYEMVSAGQTIEQLESQLAGDFSPFHDHLQRLYNCLEGDAGLLACAHSVMNGDGCGDQKSFLRLRSSGVVTGESARTARPRCGLYRLFFVAHQ